MLKNTNSSTIYQLQGTICRLMRSTLMRWVQCSMFNSPPQSPRRVEVISLTVLLSPPLGESEGALIHFLLFLHTLVTIPTFLFRFYFIRGKRFVTGRFLHKYTVNESRKMLMGGVIAGGNKVANLKSGQITFKR